MKEERLSLIAEHATDEIVIGFEGGNDVACVYSYTQAKQIIHRFNLYGELLEALKASQAYMLGKCTALDLVETDALVTATLAKAEEV